MRLSGIMNWVLRMEWLLRFPSSSLQLRCLVCCTQFCGQFQQSNLHPSDSSTGFGSWSYQFWEQSKPNFWQKLQWTHLPTWSCLQPLYSFWASFLNSVTMWLMVSSRSPHILHNEDKSSPSILFLILLVLNVWSWAAVYEAFCFFH